MSASYGQMTVPGSLGLSFDPSTATRVLAAYLFETTPTDPITLVTVIVVFLTAGVLACAAPAWKATRVDPWVTLGAE